MKIKIFLFFLALFSMSTLFGATPNCGSNYCNRIDNLPKNLTPLTPAGEAYIRSLKDVVKPDWSIDAQALQIALQANDKSIIVDNKFWDNTITAANEAGKTWIINGTLKPLPSWDTSPLPSSWGPITLDPITWSPVSGWGGNTPKKDSMVIVTEIIPGADCRCDVDWDPNYAQKWACTSKTPVPERKYRCYIPPGFSSFQMILAEIIRYVVYTSMLLGVLALTVMGILWSIAGADEPKVKAMKGWFINIIIGLTILFFFRIILSFLAPWIFQ